MVVIAWGEITKILSNKVLCLYPLTKGHTNTFYAVWTKIAVSVHIGTLYTKVAIVLDWGISQIYHSRCTRINK